MQTLTNAVNCIGIMGKGIALEFKERFPNMYSDYIIHCKYNRIKLGQPYLFSFSSPWILNFPTKFHWKSNSCLKDIVDGLIYLNSNYKKWGITSLAVPALGCGYGNLIWKDVRPILISHLEQLEIPIELYSPI